MKTFISALICGAIFGAMVMLTITYGPNAPVVQIEFGADID